MSAAPTLQAIRYRRGHLELLNQLELPGTFSFESIETVDAAWEAIRSMKVRGAPAIAIAATLALAVEVWNRRHSFLSPAAAADFVCNQLAFLSSSRPTAVNMTEASQRLQTHTREVAQSSPGGAPGAQRVVEAYVAEAERMLEKDLADNRAIGAFGAQLILSEAGGPVSVITHCNTGSLATAGFGTALGVVRTLHALGKLERAYATETRPFNQGSRLTAFELVYERIPATLVADSSAAFLMARRSVDAVVVGADRVVANGDTANKIGTYQLAIAARQHGVPFYIAAPTASFDLTLEDGSGIPIEERPAREMTHLGGTRIAADGIHVWNPAFDVTPADLISGYITEKGVLLTGDAPRLDLAAFLSGPGQPLPAFHAALEPRPSRAPARGPVH